MLKIKDKAIFCILKEVKERLFSMSLELLCVKPYRLNDARRVDSASWILFGSLTLPFYY